MHSVSNGDSRRHRYYSVAPAGSWPLVRTGGFSKTSADDVPAYVLVVVACKGVPGRVVVQLMGHANVDTTLNVSTQVLDGSLRNAVETVGGELFTNPRSRACDSVKKDRKDWCALHDSNVRPPGS